MSRILLNDWSGPEAFSLGLDTWGPSELLSSDHVNVKVEDRLATLLTFIDHNTVAVLIQLLLFRNLGRHDH